MYEYKGVKISWLGHDGFRIKGEKTIYVDPFKITATNLEPADYLLISHEHMDHCSPEDAKKVCGPGTVILTIKSCEEKLKGQVNAKEIRIVSPGQGLKLNGVELTMVPAYNTNKFREPGIPFHPKADGKVGFIVKMGGVSIYHTGDSDFTEEMGAVKNIDVALIPVSGTYVMTAEEAAQATDRLAPKLAIPMHYGTIVGSDEDARKFKNLVKACPVEVLSKE